jgi:hypothetical protein
MQAAAQVRFGYGIAGAALPLPPRGFSAIIRTTRTTGGMTYGNRGSRRLRLFHKQAGDRSHQERVAQRRDYSNERRALLAIFEST